MKYIHIFVEEPSIKRVLDVIVPDILPENTFFRVYPHQGKQDLEKALISTIPNISKTPGSRIIVSRDQDSGDCRIIKSNINEILNGKISCPYKIRIVCKELESWFLGDLNAIEKAYDRFKSETISMKAEMRNVDLINKPSDFLLKYIPEYNKSEYLPKLENADRIAPFLVLESNKSKSFNHMIEAIKFLSGI